MSRVGVACARPLHRIAEAFLAACLSVFSVAMPAVANERSLCAGSLWEGWWIELLCFAYRPPLSLCFALLCFALLSPLVCRAEQRGGRQLHNGKCTHPSLRTTRSFRSPCSFAHAQAAHVFLLVSLLPLPPHPPSTKTDGKTLHGSHYAPAAIGLSGAGQDGVDGASSSSSSAAASGPKSSADAGSSAAASSGSAGSAASDSRSASGGGAVEEEEEEEEDDDDDDDDLVDASSDATLDDDDDEDDDNDDDRGDDDDDMDMDMDDDDDDDDDSIRRRR